MSRYRPYVYLPSLLLLACGGTDGKIAAVSTLELTVVGTPPSVTTGSLRAALLWTSADYSLFEVAATADAPAPGQTVKFSHIAPPVNVMEYFRKYDTWKYREASLGVVVLFEDGDGDGTLAQDFDPERPLAFAPAVRRPDRIVGIAHDQAAVYFGGPYSDDGAPVELDPFLDTDNEEDWLHAHNWGRWFSVRNFDGVPQGLMLAKLNCVHADELSVEVGGQGIVEVEGLVRAPEPRFEDRIQLLPQPKPRACRSGGAPWIHASSSGDNQCEDPAPWPPFYWDGVPGARCIVAEDCASICCPCPDKPMVYMVSMCSGDAYCADATTACGDVDLQRWECGAF